MNDIMLFFQIFCVFFSGVCATLAFQRWFGRVHDVNHVQFIDWWPSAGEAHQAVFSNGKWYYAPAFIFKRLHPLAYYDLKVQRRTIVGLVQEYIAKDHGIPTVEE